MPKRVQYEIESAIFEIPVIRVGRTLYQDDAELVRLGIEGIDSDLYKNKNQAAKALAQYAEGSSRESTVRRLNRKIAEQLKRNMLP